MKQDFSADHAPGSPGMQPNWCNGAKQMVGTSLGTARVWFTIGQGILNEIYYPRVDIPQVRDLGFIISNGKDFWQEIKELADCKVECIEAGIPAVTVTHKHPRFTFIQRIVPEPNRDVLLVEISLTGDADLLPYVLLAPHLGGTGRGNYAEVGKFHNRRILSAWQGPFGLALAAVDAKQQDVLGVCSAGYSGVSDGWQDFKHNDSLTKEYQQAGPGTVALTGELPRKAVIALGFASSHHAAATLAVSSLMQPFEQIWQLVIGHWRHWHQTCQLPRLEDLTENLDKLLNLVKTSAMVLRTHYDQTYRGALVASLSIPWGETQEERPGYHLVWPRDLVECSVALLALGREVEAQEVLRYLMASQREDGSWFQNQWLGGEPFWSGIQLDQVAFPVLLASALADKNALNGIEVQPMVQQALGFIARSGPVSPQDRWEEDSGVNTFTMAVCISALVCGARFLPKADETFVLELADFWNERLSCWAAVKNTPFAEQHGISSYYPRIMPATVLSDDKSLARIMPIKNHLADPGLSPDEQIGVDFLQLVRYGLRAPNDPLIKNTIKLVDELLKVELSQGPCWYRYNLDGYGEHADGQAYDGTGIGRLWPLLTGERGHYELLRGADALPFLQAMANMADEGGMLPEQIWDTKDVPEYRLKTGRPTGSAMPLAWAHAEFIKLACSIAIGHPVDRPEPVWERYQGKRPEANLWYWSPQAPLKTMPKGRRLGLYLPQPAAVFWQYDDYAEESLETKAIGLGVHLFLFPEFYKVKKSIRFRLDGYGNKDEMYQVVIV